MADIVIKSTDALSTDRRKSLDLNKLKLFYKNFYDIIQEVPRSDSFVSDGATSQEDDALSTIPEELLMVDRSTQTDDNGYYDDAILAVCVLGSALFVHIISCMPNV